MKIQISLSATRAPQAEKAIASLKKEVALRSQYEKLKTACGGKFSKNATAIRKFQAWKLAHPDYPKVKLAVLSLRLRNALEAKTPGLRAARSAKEAGDTAARRQKAALEKACEKLVDELADLNNKDYDYMPDDVDNPEKYKQGIKDQIKKLRAQIRKLDA